MEGKYLRIGLWSITRNSVLLVGGSWWDCAVADDFGDFVFAVDEDYDWVQVFHF